MTQHHAKIIKTYKLGNNKVLADILCDECNKKKIVPLAQAFTLGNDDYICVQCKGPKEEKEK